MFVFFNSMLALQLQSENFGNCCYSLCTFSPARREKSECCLEAKPLCNADFYFVDAAFCCYEWGVGSQLVY